MRDKKQKTSLICNIVVLIIFAIALIALIIYGSEIDNDTMIIVGVLFLIIFAFLGISEIIEKAVKLKKSSKNLDVEEELPQSDNKLFKQYLAINNADINDLGFVSFVNEGIKFSAEGKFGCVKDFNNKKGYHLAFNIKGTKLVSTPKDYEDIIDYANLLFNIDLGYFEGCLLSEPENDNGIIVDDISTLEGKTIEIAQDQGYIAQIDTAETDLIDFGEIQVVEWKEDSKIIKFKLVVEYGLCDIIVGTLKLTEDKEIAK